jgi:serine/alanine adding enzyme
VRRDRAWSTKSTRSEENMNVTITRALPNEQWRCFVEGHPQGNVFHTPEVFEVFSRAKGHYPVSWAVVGENGNVLALLPLAQVTVLGRRLGYFTTRAIAYGGVLCAPGLNGQEALATLLRTYTRQGRGTPLFTELRNLSDLSEVQPVLQENGFVYEEHLNYLVDVDLPPDDILGNMSKSARKKIRRALRKSQLEVVEVHNRSQVAACYSILQETYARARLPLAHPSLFDAAFDILYPRGMAKFLLGRIGDTYVAASVVLLYKDTIYGWYRGFKRDYSSYLPNDLMVWHTLKWGAENGYRTFDFGGAGNPDKEYGPRRFKAKFGGALTNYGRNTCIHAPIRLKISRTGYRLLRRLLQETRRFLHRDGIG